MASGVDVQFRAVLAALTGDRMAEAALNGTTLDDRVIERVARIEPNAPALLEAMGVRIAGRAEPRSRPSLGWRADWRPVLKAAVRWAAARFSDDSVAAAEACRICAAHGWALDGQRAYRLVREWRTRRQGAA